MNLFTFTRASDVGGAVRELAEHPNARFIAGGTNILDLMKENVARPARLVDITRLPIKAIEPTAEGGLRLGAVATNTETAYHPEVERRYPLISKAILAGASQQIRNMATNGGNLLQRTRCWYFYDTATPCNKREPGTGCGARDGVNRIHAILGHSTACIAVHPSDLCVALEALQATIQVTGPDGDRAIPFAEFLRLPGETPHIDNNLRADEIITAIDLPPQGYAAHHAYLKIRDRVSFAFALVSVAVGVELDGDTIRSARIALGGVAHKPWRVPAAELLVEGKPATDDNFARVAQAYVEAAHAFKHNAFKIELAKRAIVRGLREAIENHPHPGPPPEGEGTGYDRRSNAGLEGAETRYDRGPNAGLEGQGA
jgi:xanthine dehydrogenase YagS FAD-binding subunit